MLKYSDSLFLIVILLFAGTSSCFGSVQSTRSELQEPADTTEITGEILEVETLEIVNITMDTPIGSGKMQSDDNLQITEREFFRNTVEPTTIKDALIKPDNQTQRIKEWGLDLKHGSKMRNFTNRKVAEEILNNYDITSLRTSIYAKGGHPSAGTVEEDQYSDLLKAVQIGQDIQPDIKIFASLKLRGPGSDTFPNWVLDANEKVIPSKYAVLLSDYLIYMKRKGVIVDYLGIDNERTFNEGGISPKVFKEVADQLKANAEQGKFEMPMLIAPEDYGPKPEWIYTLKTNEWDDRLDIVGTHYYPKWRPLDKLKNMVSAAGEKPLWNTEAHWKKKDNTFKDGLKAMIAVFDSFDVGCSSLTWWGMPYVNTTEFRGKIAIALTESAYNSRPVEMNDFDGKEMDLSKYNTRAFLKDKDLVIWVLNGRESKVEKNGFKLDSWKMDGKVTYIQWVGKSAPTYGEATKTSDTRFELPIPGKSITKVKVSSINKVK